jgi:hypothetical protein
MTANILKNGCHDAQVDPDLEPLTGKILVSSDNLNDEISFDVNVPAVVMET